MSLTSEFLQLIERIDVAYEIPPVKTVYVPPVRPDSEKQADFGILVLQDGSSGLFYTMLEGAAAGYNQHFDAEQLCCQAPKDIALMFRSHRESERTLGLAAINAITAFVYKTHHYIPDTAGDSIGELNLVAGDRLGMVGYFKPLLDRLNALPITLTVLEKKTNIEVSDSNIRLQHDPRCLENCNKILCTASALLNNSIESLLTHTRHAEAMVVIGPTAGFFPDPLFARMVTAIGGSRVVDAEQAMRNLQQGRGMGNSVVKYLIKRAEYPGIEHIATLV